jgi:hypothetical protein
VAECEKLVAREEVPMARRPAFPWTGLWLLAFAIPAPVARGQGHTIEITSVPPDDDPATDNGYLSGVTTAPAGSYQVATYVFLEGLGWYIKPVLDACTPIVNGAFTVDVETGGVDHHAHRYAVFAVPVTWAVCPSAFRAEFLPAALAGRAFDVEERTLYPIAFAGETWARRASPYLGSPDPPNYNCFSPAHVWVDEQGWLHLRLAPRPAAESCPADVFWGAELWPLRRTGYGEYRFHTSGPVDSLDPQAVFGAFTWDPDFAPEHRELDVEVGRWGQPADPNAQYVVQSHLVPDHRERFTILPADSASGLTFILSWAPGSVTFSAWRGHHAGVPPESSLIHRWTHADGHVPPAGCGRWRFNLWRLASPAQAQEVVVTSFAHDLVFRDGFQAAVACPLVVTSTALSPAR